MIFIESILVPFELRSIFRVAEGGIIIQLNQQIKSQFLIHTVKNQIKLNQNI